MVFLLLVGVALGAMWWWTRAATAAPGSSAVTHPPASDVNAPPGAMAAGDAEQGSAPDQREEAPSVAVSPTSSAPERTFEGHLAHFVQRHPADSPTPAIGERDAEFEVRNRDVNPLGKQLDAAQLDGLRSLLRPFDQQERALHRENRQLTRAALVRAVEAGDYLTREQPSVGAADPEELVRQHRQRAERDQRDQQEMMATLTGRLGTPMRDWGYSVCGTVEPDGIARKTIVFFTRAAAPEVFACRDRVAEFERARRAALQQYFASLP
ncbi:MAG: hypothetical protein JNL08_00380 [Planctomycetes bacterium]|nr:hypothetical protein [Planctomycetota bacterium]